MFKKSLISLFVIIFSYGFTYATLNETVGNYDSSLSDYNNAKIIQDRAYADYRSMPDDPSTLAAYEQARQDRDDSYNSMVEARDAFNDGGYNFDDLSDYRTERDNIDLGIISDDSTDTTVPVTTDPETTGTAATEPAATEPETTEPEATEPEATEPEAAGKEANSKLPRVNCIGLPGCVDSDISNPTAASTTKNLGIEVINNVIGNIIQFVAVIAVIALILSGIMYLISGGEEEKVKKAKTWIIWSLVGVFLSVTAWGIIGMLNELIIG